MIEQVNDTIEPSAQPKKQSKGLKDPKFSGTEAQVNSASISDSASSSDAETRLIYSFSSDDDISTMNEHGSSDEMHTSQRCDNYENIPTTTRSAKTKEATPKPVSNI